MKYRVQRGTKEGALAPEGWREIEAKDMQAAAVAHLRTLHPVRENYPITVYVSDDTRLHPNGTPMEVHGYRFEAVPPRKEAPAPTADDIKHELQDARYADGRNAWDSAAAMTADVSAELRRRGIPHSPAHYDSAGNCLTCGEAGRCPGVHTFEEIQAASRRAQKGNKPTAEALAIFKSLTPRGQFAAVLEGMRGEEGQFFADTVTRIAAIWRDMPKTYETDGQGRDALARLHWFTGGCDWWLVEKDIDSDGKGQIQAFGVADLGQGCRELGYINLVEILDAGAELDFHYTPVSVGEILKGGK